MLDKIVIVDIFALPKAGDKHSVIPQHGINCRLFVNNLGDCFYS